MSWEQVLGSVGVRRRCTRIEIKPHNRAGIQEGVTQLLGKRWANIANPQCPPGQAPRLFLVTYELLPAPSVRAWVRIMQVTATTGAAVGQRKWSPQGLPFKLLGYVNVAALNQTMPQRECPTRRGELMEPEIRKRYEEAMKRWFTTWLPLPTKAVSATGPDIDHEFAAFLAELATELGEPALV